jgi:hypothetical protein
MIVRNRALSEVEMRLMYLKYPKYAVIVMKLLISLTRGDEIRMKFPLFNNKLTNYSLMVQEE